MIDKSIFNEPKGAAARRLEEYIARKREIVAEQREFAQKADDLTRSRHRIAGELEEAQRVATAREAIGTEATPPDLKHLEAELRAVDKAIGRLPDEALNRAQYDVTIRELDRAIGEHITANVAELVAELNEVTAAAAGEVETRLQSALDAYAHLGALGQTWLTLAGAAGRRGSDVYLPDHQTQDQVKAITQTLRAGVPKPTLHLLVREGEELVA